MSFTLSLTRFFSVLTFGFLVCIAGAAIMEDYGIGRQWIGYFFIFVTLGAYAVIACSAAPRTCTSTLWPRVPYPRCTTAWPQLQTG